VLSLLLLPSLLPILAGCVSEEEKAAALRSQYKATLSGFTVVQEPHPAAGVPVDAFDIDQDVELAVAVERGEGAEGSGGEGLPGLTLDVAQLDAAGREKRRWRVWADTGELAAGATNEVQPRLEDVDYRPGDRFQVEVRGEVPPAERGEYREFSGGSSGS
jgi:hypothetical protein